MVEYHDYDFDWYSHAARVKPLCEAVPIMSPADQQGSDESSTWDAFYTAHKTFKFFKPKRYLPKAFSTLVRLNKNPELQRSKSMLEIGCGYGSAAFPILATLKDISFSGVDVSERAVDGFKDKAAALDLEPDVIGAKVCNVAQERIPYEDASFDMVLLCFTLSAIAPERHKWVVQEACRLLAPGGVLLFRDYGLYDFVQLRCTQRLGLNHYIKSDGVQCYFFSLAYLSALLHDVGLTQQNQKYCTVRNVNRKTGEQLHRVFINAEYVKN